MKPLLAALRALALLIVFVVGAHAEGFSAVPLHDKPQPLPEIAFTDAAGETVTLETGAAW